MHGQVGYDAMLQPNLVLPLAVDARELLLGLDTIIVDAEQLALFPSLLQAGKLGCIGFRLIGGCSVRAGVGLGFQPIVLRHQACRVRFRLLHGLLNQLRAAALVVPCFQPAGERAVLPRGKHGQLAVACLLSIVLAHGRLVGRKLLLNPGAQVARCPGQIMLRIAQVVLIQVQLRLGDFQIVIAAAVSGRRQSVYLGLILLDRLLQLCDLLRKFQGLSGGGEPLSAGLAQRGGKRLVHLVIGQAFGFVCILLFFFAHGEGGERLSNLPGMQVDDGRLLGTTRRLLAFEEG
jgi:hypothetical protein